MPRDERSWVCKLRCGTRASTGQLLALLRNFRVGANRLTGLRETGADDCESFDAAADDDDMEAGEDSE